MKHSLPLAVLVALLLTAPAFSQAEKAAEESKSPAEPKTQASDEAQAPAADAPAKAQEEPSAEQVLNELLKRRSENPLIEPAPRRAAPKRQPQGADGAPAPTAVGTAPEASMNAPLRREGQFVITRRARMVRAPGGGSGWMLVFEADSSGLQDPPMYVLPCQLLEDMEEMLQQQGEAAVFVVSGQIYAYRGANYIMPTLMKLAPSRGNLQP